MALKLALKTGIATTTIYYSKELDVWGNSKQATDLCNCISNQLNPTFKQLKEKLPFEKPYLPSTGEVSYLTRHYYNQGVKNTFYFIKMLPCYVGRYSKQGYEKVQHLLDSPQTAN